MNTQVNDAAALVKQGFQRVEQQRFDEAVASFDQAIALDPDFAEAWISRGIILDHLGRFEEAVASYDRVLALGPDAQAFNHRGLALYKLGRLDEAVASYDHALALQPDAQAFNIRGLALYKLGRFGEAVASYDGALALQPDYAEVFNNRGIALAKLGRFDQALDSIDRAIALGSGSAEVCLAISAVLLDHGRLGDALACYDRALTFDPDHAEVRFHRALALLGTGDLARGFEDYRWRFRIENEARRPARPDCLACPDWEGEPLAGKRLVIFVEQGYGDALQFVRYVPMAQARGARVTLFAPLALLKLLRTSLPGVEVTDRLPDTAVFDFQAPMLCLPRLFGTTLDTIPADVPYLVADQAAAAAWAQRLAALPGLKVGLVWAGSSRLPSIDARRSLRLAQFAPLAAIPGIRFVSLQLGEPAEEIKTPPAGLRLLDWTDEIGDYADTAALVAGLDLVITVDTSVAHLAGALGRPVWILSRFDGCWRWLNGREDSPWYPTARLLHQPAMGAWEPVMAKVAAALRAFASGHGAPSSAASPHRTDDAAALVERGRAFYRIRRLDEALACYDGALALEPEAATFNLRGEALYDLGRCDEALACYERALALEPDRLETHFNRTRALLRTGDLARGFAAYRLCFRLYGKHEELAAFTCPDWEGEPLAGKRLVIFAEHGYGDTLQFVRYVPMALARGARVTLLVRPALLRLLRASLPGVEVVDHLPKTAVFDFQIPMLCLPGLFGTTLDTIPADVPYLVADRTAAAAWARRLAALPGLKVGLVWAGDSQRSFNELRSLKLAQFAPLAAIPGIRFVSLQLGETAAQTRTPPAGLRLTDWTGEIGDYADTAALVAGLDLVITVCTSVAHLAGALGKPVWVLLRYDSCWRWLMGREDSPWYGTARLFQQTSMGDWAPVMAKVATALQTLAPETSAPPTAAGPHRNGDAMALVKQGFQQVEQQRFDEAVASFDRAIALDPDFAEAWISRGIILAHLGRYEDAVASYDRVLALGPDAQALNHRALALYQLDRLDEAVAGYDRALALQPDAATFNARGLALYKLGRFDEAVASYDGALALEPDYAEACNGRGAALAKLQRFSAALKSIDQAIALGSPSSAAICQDIGVALHNLGRPEDALAYYDRVLALDPDHADMRFHRALALLGTGDLARGFEDYRWRFRVENRAKPIKPDWLTCPEWEGEPLAGKRLVIYVEQGYGDTLQFVRYVPMAQARGARVTLFIPPTLLRLLRASLPGIEVADRLPDTAVFDFQAPMLCLPRLFGTTLDTIPADVPYLVADQAAAAAWTRRLAALPGLKVGLVWAGGRSLPSVDARRSLRLAQFAPLAAIPGIRFVSLQLGEPAEEIKTPPAGLRLLDWTDEIGDYADTAALVAGLDLVITVDTSVAHLAGALGRPVWILSRFDGCWRWLKDRDDSPWYPTARLFRQPAMGAWEPVMAEVTTALRAFASRQG